MRHSLVLHVSHDTELVSNSIPPARILGNSVSNQFSVLVVLKNRNEGLQIDRKLTAIKRIIPQIVEAKHAHIVSSSLQGSGYPNIWCQRQRMRMGNMNAGVVLTSVFILYV